MMIKIRLKDGGMMNKMEGTGVGGGMGAILNPVYLQNRTQKRGEIRRKYEKTGEEYVGAIIFNMT